MVETCEFERNGRENFRDEEIAQSRKRVNAAIYSKDLIDLLDVGDVDRVVQRMERIQRQLREEGANLNFDSCEGLKEAVRETRNRLRGMGRTGEAEVLARAFADYFEIL
jgi:hypothetical protein